VGTFGLWRLAGIPPSVGGDRRGEPTFAGGLGRRRRRTGEMSEMRQRGVGGGEVGGGWWVVGG